MMTRWRVVILTTRHIAKNKWTQQIGEILGDGSKSAHMFDFDKSCHPADYRTFLESDRVYVAWREPYRNRWVKVAEMQIENGDDGELQRIFNHEPMRAYIDNVCVRRTHHPLHFEKLTITGCSDRKFAFEILKCICWGKISKSLKPGAAFEYYKKTIRNMFTDASRAAGAKKRLKARYSDAEESRLPKPKPKSILVKGKRPRREKDSTAWTGT